MQRDIKILYLKLTFVHTVAKNLKSCILSVLVINTAERQQNPSTSSGRVPDKSRGRKNNRDFFIYDKRNN